MDASVPDRWAISRAAFDAMAARAEGDYPEETCGLVFGPDAGIEVVPLKNIQNELHRKHPDVYTRDARTAYEFDSIEKESVISEREAAGKPLRAIYHSHPDHDAYFSPTDRQAAAPPGWGPIHPGVVYLVFSVYAGKLRRAAGFVWSEESQDFVEVPIERGG